MMISTLLEGKVAADFDSEITDQFVFRPGSLRDVRDERMQVGVRNERGEIYRAIGITGMNEFLGIVQHLIDIGLVDELQTSTSARHGYDAIFSA
jgi:hypothetical protein